MAVCVLAGRPGPAAAAVVCPPAPPAVRDIASNQFYSDSRHSVIDPAAYARYLQSVEPLDAFERDLARFASRAQKGQAGWGACAGTWLAAWAADGALLGRFDDMQAQFVRKWALAALAMDYLRARAAVPAAVRAPIEGWLRQVAAAVTADYRGSKGRQRNNHAYWFGFALAATAFATGDAETADIAAATFDAALGQIGPDGQLPLETARGVRALHYHNFSVLPLVMMAEIAAQQGQDWYARQGGALHRLIRFTLDNAQDAAALKAAAGVAVEPLGPGDPGWIALYGRRFPDRLRPGDPPVVADYWITWAGGDMTVLAHTWGLSP